MNDTWYVQKGVELVGWQWDENTLTGRKFFELPQTKREQELGCSSTWVEDNNQVGRDALAAQLVRQHIDKFGRVEGTVEYEEEPIEVIKYVVDRMY